MSQGTELVCIEILPNKNSRSIFPLYECFCGAENVETNGLRPENRLIAAPRGAHKSRHAQ